MTVISRPDEHIQQDQNISNSDMTDAQSCTQFYRTGGLTGKGRLIRFVIALPLISL